SLNTSLSATASKSGEATKAPATKGATENITELAEYIIHIHATAAKSAAALKGRMAVLVITGLFIGVAQYFICLGRLFKHFLGLGIPGVFIGMVFDRLLAISLFYFCRSSIFTNAQDVIIILLHILFLISNNHFWMAYNFVAQFKPLFDHVHYFALQLLAWSRNLCNGIVNFRIKGIPLLDFNFLKPLAF